MKNENEKVKHNYEIKTNVIVLSKISDLLDTIEIDNIPILDFDEKDTETFVTSLELRFSQNTEDMNSFLQTVTGTTDNFLEKDLDIIHAVFLDFFSKLPPAFVSMIKLLLNELRKQKDLAIQMNLKAMEKSMEKILKAEMDKPET